MPDVRLRPRFRRDVSCPPRAVLGTLAEAIRRNDAGFTGTVFESSAVLRMPADQVHFWSPQLHLAVDPEASGASVHGLFGPHPTVWSLFVGLYVAIGFTATMGAMVGIAQWMLDLSTWALWSVPAGAALAFVVWVVGRTGRRLGHAQVRLLFDFVQAHLDVCEAPSRAA